MSHQKAKANNREGGAIFQRVVWCWEGFVSEGEEIMGHFIDRFSSPLSGWCPVAVDDIEQRIRYPLIKGCHVTMKNPEAFLPAKLFAWVVNNSDIMWQDYPESHHVEGG